MPRIAQAEIDRVKREVPLMSLAASAGVTLTGHGSNLLGRCPFHDDREPSLVIDPHKNLWNCLGACKAGGDSIQWVMKREGVGFQHAVEILRAMLGGEAVALNAAKSAPKLMLPVAVDADAAEALRAVCVEYYPSRLVAGSAGWQYLEKRGVLDVATLKRLKIGEADRTLGLRLPERNRADGARLRRTLADAGLLRDSGHEHLRGCVTFPIVGEDGAVLGCYGRRIEVQDGIRHLYLPGPHRGVWNWQGVEQAGKTGAELIVCEAIIDALTFLCAGFSAVTAAYGTGGFTADHWAALKRHGVRRVLIAYDRDEAGDKAAAALATDLTVAGISAWRVRFPSGMDANEYAQTVTPARKALEVVIGAAQWVGRGPAPARSTATHSALVTQSAETTVKTGLDVAVVAAPPAAPASSLAADPSSAAPKAPAVSSASVSPSSSGDEITLDQAGRVYRVKLPRSAGGDALKVSVRLTVGALFTLDSVDLSSRRSREGFAAAAAEDCQQPVEMIRADLGTILFSVEEAQARRRAAAEVKPDPIADMLPADRAAAEAFLRRPDLMAATLADVARTGLVGEQANVETALVALISRKLDQPLAIVVQSLSGAGKTSLMEGVLALMPPEEQVKYSAISKQSLFYLGADTDLRHKVLALVEEEGAQSASYALKLLQSEGELTIASTGKDPQSGRMVTHEYRVQGPVMLFLTTTAVDLDEELQNRCIVLTVDEDRAQTKAVHQVQRQRRTLEGRLAGASRTRLLRLHQNAQRLIRSIAVVNPWAPHLRFPDHRTRMRRDHAKYLALIDAITLWHQYQRPLRRIERDGVVLDYIEATLDDIAAANRLAHAVLGRGLDELAPQTRRVLKHMGQLVDGIASTRKIPREQVRFTRRDLREHVGISNTQARLHLERLEALEYVIAHRGAHGQTFVYELAFIGSDDDGGDGGPRLPGLIDVAELRRLSPSSTAADYGYDANMAEFEGHLAGDVRGENGGMSARVPSAETSENTDLFHLKEEAAKKYNKTHDKEAADSARRSDTGVEVA